MQDLVSTVILLGVLQGLVLAPVLWARRANRLANRILGVFIGLVSLMMLLGDLEHRWGFSGHPHLLGLAAPLPFLFGPLLYLYVVSLTRPILEIDRRWVAHALPCVAYILYMTQVFYLKTGDEKLLLAAASETGNAPWSFQLVGFLEVGQALTYLVLAWKALERYATKMHGYFSDLTKIDLRWLKAFVAVQLVVWTIVLVSFVLRVFGSPYGALGSLVQLGSAIAIFLTGYVSLWQPELVEKATAAKIADPEITPLPIEPPVEASAEPEAAPAPEPAPPPPPKYQRNRLDDAEAKEIVAKLETLMAEEELYRDGGLTLPVLAEAVGITPHMLSQVLNVRVGKSFFVFVNTYRTEALERMLVDPSKAGRTVLELAHEVGFNSKSTLNSFFKKHTGLTPTEYRARGATDKKLEKSSG